MNSFLSNLSIRFKLSIGAGVFIFILLLLGVLVFISEKKVLGSVTQVVEVAQPRVLSAVKMSTEIKEAVGAFSFFLLSEEQGQKQEYESKVAVVDDQILQLKQLYQGLNDARRQELIGEIETTFNQIKQLNAELATIAGNVALRIPGQDYAAKKIGPLTQQSLSLLSNIANGEFEDEDAMKLLHEIDQLWLSWTRFSGEIRAYLTFRTDDLKNTVQDFFQLIKEKQQNILESGDLELDQEEAFEQMVQVAEKVEPHLAELFKIHSGEHWRADVSFIRSKLLPPQQKLDNLIAELTDLEKQAISETSEELVTDVNYAGKFSLLLVILGIVIGTVVMLLAITVVTRRINATVSALEDIAYGSGDLDQQLDASGNDEISRLALAYNTFVAKIKEVVDEVVNSAASLATESEKINASTLSSQEQVARQGSDLDVIELAVDAMATSSDQVSEKARSASEAAESASQYAQKGQSIVDEVVAAISNLSDEVENTTNVVHEVESQSEQIGMVLSVIRNISEQTNLLALNAAIEAARAGEQGRGFAVVADEVRTLSEKIHAETDEIQSIIHTLQDGAKKAVASMQKGVNSTQVTVEMAGNANEALQSISETIRTIVDMNTGIADLTHEQATSTQDIRQKVHSINASASETQKTVDSALESSTKFNAMAGNLNALVEQFVKQK